MRKEELRHLDAAIALLVGKCEQVHVDPTTDKYWMWTPDVVSDEVPCYSTDGNAMLELDREMRKRGYCVNVECLPPIYCAEYWKLDADGNEMELVAAKHHEKEEIARALAAYKALTGEDFNLEEVE